jgi:hypothetical protein
MEIFKKYHYQVFGNHKEENYFGLVADLLHSYKAMGCNMVIYI